MIKNLQTYCLDLDDNQRPPNTLMMYGDKNYTGNITLVHQNSELKKMHQDHLGSVSTRCVDQRLKKDLMKSSHRAAFKTLLIPRKRKKRLQFALRYLHWSVDDMKRVMWSDESTSQFISSNEYRKF